MKEANIILGIIQQADGKEKKRPALILRTLPPFDDLLCCGISSQVRHAVPDFDEIMDVDDDDFPDSGLKVTSLIRLGFIHTLAKERVIGTLGAISKERHRKLCARLANHINP